MESQPQNPEFRINPENFHPYNNMVDVLIFQTLVACQEGIDKQGRP